MADLKGKMMDMFSPRELLAAEKLRQLPDTEIANRLLSGGDTTAVTFFMMEFQDVFNKIYWKRIGSKRLPVPREESYAEACSILYELLIDVSHGPLHSFNASIYQTNVLKSLAYWVSEYFGTELRKYVQSMFSGKKLTKKQAKTLGLTPKKDDDPTNVEVESFDAGVELAGDAYGFDGDTDDGYSDTINNADAASTGLKGLVKDPEFLRPYRGGVSVKDFFIALINSPEVSDVKAELNISGPHYYQLRDKLQDLLEDHEVSPTDLLSYVQKNGLEAFGKGLRAGIVESRRNFRKHMKEDWENPNWTLDEDGCISAVCLDSIMQQAQRNKVKSTGDRYAEVKITGAYCGAGLNLDIVYAGSDEGMCPLYYINFVYEGDDDWDPEVYTGERLKNTIVDMFKSEREVSELKEFGYPELLKICVPKGEFNRILDIAHGQNFLFERRRSR